MKIIKKSISILATILIVGIVYKLSIFSIIICLTCGVVFNSLFIKQENRKRCYLNKFHDVVMYMEQMIYSFKKQPKIRLALEDAQKVSSNQIKEVIEEAILNIDSKMEGSIYEESLSIIQQDYDCKKIRSLHDFLIKIEKHGGEYESYIDVLLDDINEWNDRTVLFIKEVDRVKRNVLISIGATLITCGFMAYLIPTEYRFTNHIIYQICSVLMIVTMMFAYLFVVKKLNFDWIKEEPMLSNNLVVKYYVLIEKGFDNIRKLKWTERILYKRVKKSLEKEIMKSFPDWIREVAINLQTDTVQSAIENSYEEAAFVLKRPIRKLLVDFERYPVGIEPYDLFLKEFDLPDIKSSMKMFYAINELGKAEASKQINAIIDRNNKLTNQAEEMKNKDKIGGVSMFTAIPMLVGVIKIMVDMILMIMVFTSSISMMINGG